MHVRAYNYWVSLLDGKAYPSVQDLDPHDDRAISARTASCSISPTASDDAQVAWLGGALREECDLIGDIRRISDVPKRSLLSRLTDHYLQIIANKAPIGFEAEFVGQRGQNTMYRGILMPFSSNGEDDRLHLRRDQLEGADSRLAGREPAGVGRGFTPTAKRKGKRADRRAS